MGLSSRIWLSKSQLLLIRPGLECLINRLAAARAGHFPNRNAWDLVDLQASNIHRKRGYSDDYAAMILSLRNRFQKLGAASKIRLSAFELAAVSLAIRIARCEPEVDHEIYSRLTTKVEIHRKRAIRAAIALSGAGKYVECAVDWQNFVQWIRYNLLSRYRRRPSSGALRRVWREQYEEFIRLAEIAVAERGYSINVSEGLQRIVRLALAELRRGRHPFTIRDLCSNVEQGKAFLFEFALARKAITRVHEDEPLCIRQSEIGEKIQKAVQSSSDIRITPAPAIVVDVSKPECVSDQRAISTPPGSRCQPGELNPEIPRGKRVEPSPISLLASTLDDEQIAIEVMQWFDTNVDPGRRETVCGEAQFQVRHYSTLYIVEVAYTTLADLIEKTRVLAPPVDSIETTNFAVEWLLGWLLALRRDPWLLHRIIGAGYARAKKGSGLFTAPCY